jgi:hypothetical protein
VAFFAQFFSAIKKALIAYAPIFVGIAMSAFARLLSGLNFTRITTTRLSFWWICRRRPPLVVDNVYQQLFNSCATRKISQRVRELLKPEYFLRRLIQL